MNTQPEALRLAEQDERLSAIMRVVPTYAPELRRLHDENERLLAANKDLITNFNALMVDHNRLRDMNQLLVEALEHIAKTIDRQIELIDERAEHNYLDKWPVVHALQSHSRRAHAALAKATGEKE